MADACDNLFHREWVQRNRRQPPERALESPLLALHRTSDVNPIPVAQIRDARLVLERRGAILASGSREVGSAAELTRIQRAIVERHLAGRRLHFGADQVAALPDVARMAAEGRDVFIVIKFMDEAPHLVATLRSLLNQKGVDPSRLVLIAVDNNSTDGSDHIVRDTIQANRTPIRLLYMNQQMPGAGHAARLGVDRALATVHAMCVHDGRWDRLQNAVIGVSDGDTVYAPYVVREILRILRACPDVDAVMPFLTYKLTAALRLFQGYIPSDPRQLRAMADPRWAVEVPVDLSDTRAFAALPRDRRRPAGSDAMELGVDGGERLIVPLAGHDGSGRRFGVLRDPGGRVAYLFADRTLVLEEAAASGCDEALVFLENGRVRPDEKWRWHALIGHDLFLSWAFLGMGLPEGMVFPDTSDALKTFRVWSFAIGGQHQLRRADLRIATGSDYQSGRVLQVTGGVVRLGPASAPAETEIDRLIKMTRNLVKGQGVFYGETRRPGLERATGLYVHMTRIQAELEADVRTYPDAVFEHTVFPERILFPLRWMLQNALRFAAHSADGAKRLVRDRVLGTIFPAGEAEEIERRWFSTGALRAIVDAEYHAKQDIAERMAEEIIAGRYQAIMRFYVSTLRSFLAAQDVPSDRSAWLLDGVEASRNAITEPQPRVHAATVWDGEEFQIDLARGQAVALRTAGTSPGHRTDRGKAVAP